MRIAPLGDTGLRIELGAGMDAVATDRARALAESLQNDPLPGMIEVVPSFGSVTLFYDPLGRSDPEALALALQKRARELEEVAAGPAREQVIPVCYAPEFAPDLEVVALRAGLRPEGVTALHCGVEYRVGAIGFAPGFPYLCGLPEALHTPRRSTPRTRVPAGSVAIGGKHTGIYPQVSPGGWHLIGRTPLTLFDAGAEPPARLRMGDRVRFQAISPEEFAAWK